jgi:hypothetical protein
MAIVELRTLPPEPWGDQMRRAREIAGLTQDDAIAAMGRYHIAALPELVALETELAAAIEDAVRQLRAEPFCYSWTQIGDVLGVSRQAALKRWGHVGGARVPGGQPAGLR